MTAPAWWRGTPAEAVAFLTARLDEEETTTHHAGPARIAWLTFHDADGQLLYTTVAAADDECPWIADGKELPGPASVLPVYDPARVLADIAAKRAILVRYREIQAYAARPYDAESSSAEEITPRKGYLHALEVVIEGLAGAYGDHPDAP